MCGASRERSVPGVNVNAVQRLKEATMFKPQRFILTVVVVGASFVPAATANAGLIFSNHSETLLLDA
jgi:hypothetical protein